MVVLIVECSLEMIIGMLGILKVGVGYILIDLDYFEERMNYIIEDVKFKVVVIYCILF